MATRVWFFTRGQTSAFVRAAAAGLLSGALFLLGGCATSATQLQPTPSTAVSATVQGKFFTGTPEEYAALTRACFEDSGVRTIDDPMGDETGFGVDAAGLSQAEVQDVFDKCEREVGIPQMADLSESELRDRYDARVAQHSCLAREGYAVDPVPSFDTFVDEYERSGQKTMWDPGILPDPKPGDNPTTDCPRTGHW